MSEVTDSKQSADSASRKRCPPAPGHQDEGSSIPCKSTKVDSDTTDAAGSRSKSCKTNSEAESKEAAAAAAVVEREIQSAEEQQQQQEEQSSGYTSAPVNNFGHDASNKEKPQSSSSSSGAQGSAAADSKEAAEKTEGAVQRPSASSLDQSDSAAIAAAEALASLTGRDGEDSQETPCSSEKVKTTHLKQGSKVKQRSGGQHPSKTGSKTQAAAADSSTSVHSTDREDADDVPEADEGDESVSGSSSTPSSSFPSDNEENDDGECAIVSVKMAPEMRQSVALLAQVQMRLDALEKKSARLHQRLELKISRQRRPHLDQRSSIMKTIPGFWVTAVSFTLKNVPLSPKFLLLFCI